MQTEETKPMVALTNALPEIKALIGLNASAGVNVETLAMQEIDNLKMMAVTKPDILECLPSTVVLAVKNVLKQNLSLDPYAGLVYVKTRSVKIKNAEGQDVWKKALEIQPSCNGLLSIARQCGRILDMKRPEVTKDPHSGKVLSVKVEFLLPSTPSPRWETFNFDSDDFYRWQRASHKENGRNKNDANLDQLNYANDNYTNWKGGIDPEFARAKAIRHALKKLGTNQNEMRMQKIVFTPFKEVVVDAAKDEAAVNDEAGNTTVDNPTVTVSAEVKNTVNTENIQVAVEIPNSTDL